MTAPCARGAGTGLPADPSRPAARRDHGAEDGLPSEDPCREPRRDGGAPRKPSSRADGFAAAARRAAAGPLALAAFALGGLLAGGAAQAQSNDPIWTATLTVGNDTNARGYNSFYKGSTPGTLSPSTITHAGSSHTVSSLLREGESSNKFTFQVEANTGSGSSTQFKLCLDGTATPPASFLSRAEREFTLASVPDWTLGKKVAVKLVGASDSCSPATSPEIDVQGNNVSIPDGDTAPGTADHTDFGAAAVSDAKVERTFTVRNTGDGALALTGTPKVTVGGAHASDFTVTAQPSSPVAASTGTTTFTVEFDPSGTGARTATLSVANDDTDENPYDFAVAGTGLADLTASVVRRRVSVLASLTIGDGYTDAWWYKQTKPSAGTCTSVAANTATVGLTGLSVGTEYTYQAYSDSACATALTEAVTFTTLAAPSEVPGLTVTEGADSLTVGWSETGLTNELVRIHWKSSGQDYTGDEIGGSGIRAAFALVNQPGAATTIPVAGQPRLTAGTEYTVRVFVIGSNAGDSIRHLSEFKATPGVRLEADGVTSSGATLTIRAHAGQWWHRSTTPASTACTAVPAGTATATLSGLTASTAHTWQAYSESTCTTALGAPVTFTTTAAADPVWTATMTVGVFSSGHRTGYWSNSNIGGGSLAPKTLSHGGATYTVESLHYFTSNPSKNEFKVSGSPGVTTDFKLCLDGTAAGTDTYLKAADEEPFTATGLNWEDGQTVKVALVGASETCPAGTGTRPTPQPAVSAGSVTPAGATLTVENHPPAWHHKRTSPVTPVASCSGPQTGMTATLSDLSPGTAYIWKTWSDSACATELASVSFTTPPAQVENLKVTAPADALALSWDAATGATGYEVQWKSGQEAFSSIAVPARHATVAGTSYTISGLIAGRSYTVRVLSTTHT